MPHVQLLRMPGLDREACLPLSLPSALLSVLSVTEQTGTAYQYEFKGAGRGEMRFAFANKGRHQKFLTLQTLNSLLLGAGVEIGIGGLREVKL